MTRPIRIAAIALALGVGLHGQTVAAEPDEVTICVTNEVPYPAPECGAAEGSWSATGGIQGGGAGIESCLQFNGTGVSVGITTTFTDDAGDSFTVARQTILDWENLDQCSVPQPNPCGLSCGNLHNARVGQWRVIQGTGQWENLQGSGKLSAFVNREYEGEGLCPGGTGVECNSLLCETTTQRCYRRVAHEYFSGRVQEINRP